jgi:hypothetical protein
MFPDPRIALAVAALFVATRACGSEAAEPAPEPIASLRLSGFGTLGVTHTGSTQGFGFRRDLSQIPNDGGTRFDTDTRLGLQANYTVNPQIELVGQILLKRRVAQSPPADSLEWAFASYRPTPDLQVRVGRIGPDTFLLSDYRSVGFAYPWVRPNVEVYGGLPVFSIEGIDVTKTWSLDDVSWRGRIFGGQGHARTPGAGDSPSLNARFSSEVIATLSRESGGLLVRAAVARLKLDIREQAWKQALRQGLAQVAALPFPSIAAEAGQLSDGLDPDSTMATYLALGASYEQGDWLASGEVVRLRSDIAASLSDSAYVSVGHRFGAVTAFGMLGAARTPRDAPDVPQWAGQLAPIIGQVAAANIQAVGSAAAYAAGAARIDQRSISGGMRWDVHPRVALKLQWDHFAIRRTGSLLWGTRNLESASANVVSATLDFVF